MSQSIPTLFRDGQSYMQAWPMKKELYGLFPECRVIAATRFCIRYMPAMAILVAFVHVMTLGQAALPQALAMAAFLISLPMQGLLWLGHRANQHLPPAMASWYYEIHKKMREQGCRLQQQKARPRYKELAQLLGTAFKELDRVFTRQWF